MDYVQRLDAEAMSLFTNGVRAKTYNAKRQSVVMSNKKFTEWARNNTHLFAADKK